MNKVLETFLTFLRLGFTSFGGPIAHLGFFHDEFVKKKQWLDEQAYADLVGLCQLLPGPASSQVGIAIGLSRAGYFGAIVAWLGFTLPSAIILTLFGLGVVQFNLHESWLHGLKVMAVAVVAQAIWGMAVKLCPDKERASIAVAAALITSTTTSVFVQILVIGLAGFAGILSLPKKTEFPHVSLPYSSSRKAGAFLLFVFFFLLVLLPILAKTTGYQSIRFFDSFYRAGSLVFGGGHVVLPLLQAEVIPTEWVSKELFMAGYGAAQAIPGPLFTFAAYLGSVSQVPPSGFIGAIICLIAAFLPSFLLVVGILPFLESLRQKSNVRSAMLGVNAAVVGLLLSAFYNPVWVSAILNAKDFALALLSFLFLVFWKAPAWAIALVCAIAGRMLL